MSNNTNKQPTHRAYAVTKSGDRSFWREIGALWAHSDGEGFTLKLDLLPLNGAEIVIRKPAWLAVPYSALCESRRAAVLATLRPDSGRRGLFLRSWWP